MRGHPARPSAIIFDWDNTLVDTWPTIHDALSVTLAAMGHEPWSFDDTKIRVRQSLRDSFPTLFGDRWAEARDIFYETFARNHIERLTPLPGVADLLAALSATGMDMAVLSNKTSRYLREEAVHLGWDSHFAALVGAGDAEQDKPARQSLDLALRPFGCTAGPAVWMVGDSGIDMEVAHRTGCVPVLLNSPDHTADEFKDWPPELVFKGCNSFKELVARW